MPLLHALAAVLISFVLGLGLGGWGGYKFGMNKVEAEWAKERVAYVDAAKKAHERIEQTRRALGEELEKQSDDLTQQIRRHKDASAAGRAELERLRRALAASGGASTAVAASGPKVDGAASVARELFAECVGEYLALGEEAGRLATQLTALQSYVRTLRRNPE
jgi:chromosome segregation ATPase